MHRAPISIQLNIGVSQWQSSTLLNDVSTRPSKPPPRVWCSYHSLTVTNVHTPVLLSNAIPNYLKSMSYVLCIVTSVFP